MQRIDDIRDARFRGGLGPVQRFRGLLAQAGHQREARELDQQIRGHWARLM